MRSSLASILLLSAAAVILPACKPKTAETPASTASTGMTEEDKTFYSLGVLISKNLQSFNLTAKELDQVKAGLSDGVNNKTPLQAEPEKYQEKLQELHKTRMAEAGKKEAEAGKAFLEKAATEPGAKKTASGLVISEIKAGTGASPKATDQVKVHYHGTLIDGKVFDSSVKRGEPATFPLNGVIPCWTEGVQLMKVGGKSKLVCPAEIAYGDRGAPPDIKPGSTLIFEVELLDIVK